MARHRHFGYSFPIGNSPRILARFLFAAAVCIPLSIGWFSPPNQDEFLPYHQIYCSTFSEARQSPYCAAFNLQIGESELPLRSWWYVGITPSIFYYPFYKVWPHYLSARALGFASLVLFAYLLARFVAIPFVVAGTMTLAFFPLAFQMVIDTGPVGFHLILCLLLPLLFRRRFNFLWAASIGLVVFIAIQHKALFFLLIPSIFLASLWNLRRQALTAPVLGVLLLAATAPTLWYFQLRVPQGMTYQELIQIVSGTTMPWDVAGQWQHFKSFAAPYLLAFEKFAHQCFEYSVSFSSITALLWMSILALLVYARKISKNAEITFYFVCAAAAFWTLNLSLRSSQGHHFILAAPYLLVSMAIAWKMVSQKQPRLAMAILVVFVGWNGLLTMKTLRLPSPPLESPSKMELLKEYRSSAEAKTHLSVTLDWGIYYLMALYGPKEQFVVPIDELQSQAVVDEVEKIARNAKRPICFYFHRPPAGDLNLAGIPEGDIPGWQRYCRP